MVLFETHDRRQWLPRHERLRSAPGPSQGSHRRLLRRREQALITIARSRNIKGRVVHLAEEGNVMFLQYEPADFLVGGPQAVRLESSALGGLKAGSELYYAAFDTRERLMVPTFVERVGEHVTRQAASVPVVPFRHETVRLNTTPSTSGKGGATGILLAVDGTVLGTKKSFAVTEDSRKKTIEYLLPADRIGRACSFWEKGRLGDVRYQDFDLEDLSLADTIDMGLPTEYVNQVNSHPSGKMQVHLVLLRCVGPNGKSATEYPLEAGDLVLELDGKPVLESSELPCVFLKDAIAVTVLRNGRSTRSRCRPCRPTWCRPPKSSGSTAPYSANRRCRRGWRSFAPLRSLVDQPLDRQRNTSLQAPAKGLCLRGRPRVHRDRKGRSCGNA